MAIYHFSGTVVSRSQGRSAVASAAYRAGEKLYDERQERVFDYSRKQDVLFKEILLPQGAPSWMVDREKLWNAVEKAENRKDAQLAREFNFALPRELSNEQNIELAREFVQNEFVARGMIADLCIHTGKTKCGKEEQPHAHILLTMREVSQDGFGLKERSWNAKENMTLWREAWADHANKYLDLNGIDQRIDHRSFAEMGIDLAPQKKIGPENFRIHDQRVLEHQQIARENGEKLLADPSIALNAITYHQSTFTHNDLARFIDIHTVDAEQFQEVYEKVKAYDQVVALGKDENNRERFTTKEMLELEKKMLSDVVGLENERHALREHVAIGREKAGKEHEETNTPTTITLSEQQTDALEHITNSGDIKCLIGYAGTGKSHILKDAKDAWEKSGYTVHGMTLSGIAAENLEAASGIESRTFASRNYYWGTGREHLTKNDILVIDEAGMLGTRQMARVMDEVKTHGAKLVLIGDPQQLQAIEAGAPFWAICTKTSYVELTEIRRQYEPWQQEATKEFAVGNVKSAINRYDRHDHVHRFETQALAKTSLVSMWNDVRISQPDKTQIILAYTRKEVQELNELAREYRKQNNELGIEHRLQTFDGSKAFAEGDRIYFLRNNRDLGVKNGTLGTIEKIVDSKLSVVTDRNDFAGNRQLVRFSLDDYSHITHGYAATIHKAQAITVDRSYILPSKYFNSHIAYVGVTRHRESADLFVSREEFPNDQSLLRTLSRDQSKDMALDYIQEPNKEYIDENLLKFACEEQKSIDISNITQEPEQPAERLIEEPLEVRVGRVVKECVKFVDTISYCNSKQEEFKKDGTFSPFIKECLDEARANLRQYLEENCGDKAVLSHIKRHEPQLFNDIEKIHDHILTNTIKDINSRELLLNLTKDQPELYDRVQLMEEQYKGLDQSYIAEREKVAKIYEVGGTVDNLREQKISRDAAKEVLEQYATEICEDVDAIRVLSQHDPKLFYNMNQRLDDIFIKEIVRDDLHKEFIAIHTEPFDETVSKEDRVNKTYEQYKELEQKYIDARDSIADIFKFGGDAAELREQRDIREGAEMALEQYANEYCKDKDFMGYLSQYDENAFNEMSERFNEIEREHLHEMQKELDREL